MIIFTLHFFLCKLWLYDLDCVCFKHIWPAMTMKMSASSVVQWVEFAHPPPYPPLVRTSPAGCGYAARLPHRGVARRGKRNWCGSFIIMQISGKSLHKCLNTNMQIQIQIRPLICLRLIKTSICPPPSNLPWSVRCLSTNFDTATAEEISSVRGKHI